MACGVGNRRSSDCESEATRTITSSLGPIEVGLIGSATRSSRDEVSDTDNIDSGCGRAESVWVDETLAREEKRLRLPNLERGVDVAGELDDCEGGTGDVRIGVVTAEGAVSVFQSLKPQRVDAELLDLLWSAVDIAGDMIPRAVVGGAMPMLLSAMNVRRALTQVSEASRAS